MRIGQEITYRGWIIYYDPAPIPRGLIGDFEYIHEAFDGADDGNDNRCGRASSIEDAKGYIDEYEDEEAMP